MKPLLPAIATAFTLFSAQGVAGQITQPVATSCGNVVIVPTSQEQPSFDLNHMGTGNDKPNVLGVPYCNQHAMQLLSSSDHRA